MVLAEKMNLISLMFSMMMMKVIGGEWEGVDLFEGVGLGIGSVEREFTAEIFIDGDFIQGVGVDQSGKFRFEGNLDSFSKIYDDEWCDSVDYFGHTVNSEFINGTYR